MPRSRRTQEDFRSAHRRLRFLPEKPFYTAEDLARIFDVDVATVYVWKQRKKLPQYYKFGGTVRWKAEDIINWIEEQRNG